MVQITVVAENRVALSKGLVAEHGFGVYLETGDKKILWDTGQGLALPVNGKALGVKFKELDLIALSHGHFDHTGGLEYALRESGGCDVVCHPACFENKQARREIFGKIMEIPIGLPWPREKLEGLGARFMLIEDTAEIAPGVHFFANVPMETEFERIEPGFLVADGSEKRPDPFCDDAALAVAGDHGVSVLLGCAHRGLINTLRHVKRRLGVDKIHSVWGGTHLVERSPEEVEATIAALRDLDVGIIGTAHCTGFNHEIRLAHAFPDRFAVAHVGAKIQL